MFKSLSWRLTIGLLASSGAVVLMTKGASWPSEAFWSDKTKLIVAAILFVGFAAVNGIFETTRNVRRERREELELNLQLPLRALFVGLLDDLGPEHFRDLGINCFLVRRRARPGFPWTGLELNRVASFRLKSRPRAGVRWTRGKGLIGACWETNCDVVANLEQEWAHIRTISETEWNLLDDGLRYGLSHSEYLRTKDYEVIVATPIQDKEGRFVGCISVDSVGPDYEALWSAGLREQMQDAAETVARVAKLS